MPTGRTEAGAAPRDAGAGAAAGAGARGNAHGTRPSRRGLLRETRNAALVVLLALAAACVQDRAFPPPFIGPSELALSLQLSALPDVLPLDGAARSVVSVVARDERAQPVPDLPLAVQIVTSDGFEDFGTLSVRSVTTDPHGRASFTYTAPRSSARPEGQSDPGTTVAIRVTPRADDHANAIGRSVVIRLVPPGRVIPDFRVTAGFTFSPSPAASGDPTVFRASYCDVTRDRPPHCVDDPGRLAARFAWSFSDGTRAAGRTVTHVFAAPGSYPVRLEATDSFRRTASETRTVHVEPGAVPEPAFDVSPAAPIAGAPVVFDAARTRSSRPISAYDWTLGDGATGVGRRLTHRYARPGTYLVTLTVTDALGAAASAVSEVTVGRGEPRAVIDVSPRRPTVGQPVAFSGLRSTPSPGRVIASYVWLFGDAGAAGRGGNVTHTYLTSGTYVVTLIVTDDFGASSTASATVAVGDVPAAALGPSPPVRDRLGPRWTAAQVWRPRGGSTHACAGCAASSIGSASTLSSSRTFRTSSIWPTFGRARECSSSRRPTRSCSSTSAIGPS